MIVEETPEVRLAQPAVDATADFDSDDLRDERRSAKTSREIDLSEAPLSEQALDLVTKARLRTRDDLVDGEQLLDTFRPRPNHAGRSSGGGGDS